MKTLNKLVSIFFLFVIFIVNAQKQPPAPDGSETSRGIVGPGAPASPIDMYVIGLAIIAVMLIIFFTKKYNVKKI